MWMITGPHDVGLEVDYIYKPELSESTFGRSDFEQTFAATLARPRDGSKCAHVYAMYIWL